ncbi:MAG: thiamine pyrophosphate-binding protein [Planctomycetota bacterium]
MSRSSSNDREERSLAERIAALSPEKRQAFRLALARKRIIGFDVIGRTLSRLGFTHVFGVSGRPIDEVLPACASHGVRPIGAYHQTCAVQMASAQNYVAGALRAAVIVSAGPGITNATTGILTAHENGWPVLVIGSRRDSFQRMDALPVLRPITKHCAYVDRVAAIAEALEQASEKAVSGRPGPVYVEMHEDALGSYIPRDDADSNRTLPASFKVASDDQICNLAKALIEARRPALILGKGIRWSVDFRELASMVESLELPFITSPMGRGYLPDDHPCCFNMARLAVQSSADLVLVVCARLNWMFRHGADFAPGARVIQVDIADEVDAHVQANLSRIRADAGDFIRRLNEKIQTSLGNAHYSDRQRRMAEWRASLALVRSGTEAKIDALASSDEEPISPYRLMKEIRLVLPRDAICVTEGNVSMTIAQHVIPAYGPATRLDAGTNGCMGVGIPFAMGAKLARPDRLVVAVCGDFGFSLSMMEMETLVRHKIPIVIVVVNNGGNNGALKQKFYPPDYPELVTAFQPGLRYDIMMTAVGGDGYCVSKLSELGGVLGMAFRKGRPALINMFVDPNTPLPNAWGPQQGRIASEVDASCQVRSRDGYARPF